MILKSYLQEVCLIHPLLAPVEMSILALNIKTFEFSERAEDDNDRNADADDGNRRMVLYIADHSDDDQQQFLPLFYVTFRLRNRIN